MVQEISPLLAHLNTVLCSYGEAAFITKIQSLRLPSIPTTPHHRALESLTLSRQTGKQSGESSREFWMVLV